MFKLMLLNNAGYTTGTTFLRQIPQLEVTHATPILLELQTSAPRIWPQIQLGYPVAFP